MLQINPGAWIQGRHLMQPDTLQTTLPMSRVVADAERSLLKRRVDNLQKFLAQVCVWGGVVLCQVRQHSALGGSLGREWPGLLRSVDSTPTMRVDT